jgi:hypothetical protein
MQLLQLLPQYYPSTWQYTGAYEQVTADAVQRVDLACFN